MVLQAFVSIAVFLTFNSWHNVRRCSNSAGATKADTAHHQRFTALLYVIPWDLATWPKVVRITDWIEREDIMDAPMAPVGSKN